MKVNVKIFLLIILIACVSRISYINFPQSISFEEANRGVLANFIASLGKDDQGIKFPLIFKSIGNYPLPVSVYTTSLFIKIIGFNNISVRLPGVFFGIITIPIFFLLNIELANYLSFFTSKQKNVFPYVSIFLFAISPWYIFVSRNNTPLSISLFFSLTFIFLLTIKSVKHKYKLNILLIITIILSLLSSYYSWVTLFMFLIVYLILGRKDIKKRLLLFIPFLVLVFIILSNKGYFQFLKNNLINKESLIYWDINSRRQYDSEKGIGLLARLLHNKLSYLIWPITNRHVDYYDFEFLSSPQLSHYPSLIKQIPKVFIWEIPIFLFGVYLCFKFSIKRKWIVLFLLIIPFEILPWKQNFLKKELLGFLPIFYIFLSVGFVYILNSAKKKYLFYTTVVLLMFCYFYGYSTYFKIYQNQNSWKRQEDSVYMTLFNKLSLFEKDYQNITITDLFNQPSYFTLYYLKTDPKIYLESKTESGYDQNYYSKVVSFSKYKFSSIKGVENKNPDVLYVGLRSEFVNINEPQEIINFQKNVIDYFSFEQENSNEDNIVWFVKYPKPIL